MLLSGWGLVGTALSFSALRAHQKQSPQSMWWHSCWKKNQSGSQLSQLHGQVLEMFPMLNHASTSEASDAKKASVVHPLPVPPPHTSIWECPPLWLPPQTYGSHTIARSCEDAARHSAKEPISLPVTMWDGSGHRLSQPPDTLPPACVLWAKLLLFAEPWRNSDRFMINQAEVVQPIN